MINFAELEEKRLKEWEEKEIFAKSLSRREGRPRFVMFDGPPTANAKPALHHVLARAFKDIMPRFKTMQGFYVERKAGWDTHGLPVELQIEKKLGFTGKAQIEAYGIKEFNALCKEAVWEHKGEWEKLTTRIAYWLDMEHPYITYDAKYIESLWWVIKEIDTKGYLYRGYRVVPQCGRCGTALSSHEVAQGYKTVKDTSVYVKFPVKGVAGLSLLAWTTTPWTLPGNVALAVNPTLTYARVSKGEEEYWLAKDLIAHVFEDEHADILEEQTGEYLVGMEYDAPYPEAIPADPAHPAWRVVGADYVSASDGTGIVHTAPMYGEDDYRTGEAHDLPRVHTVAEDGTFLPSVTQWAGRMVKDKKVEEEIVADLTARGLLLREWQYEHEYPFCWRCDTPLIYYAKSSWFIAMEGVKEKMREGNAGVSWTPAHIRDGRFGEWLANVRDWAISRERYWGTPLPVWECSEGHTTVIGSVEELRTQAQNFDAIYGGGGVDLHRPYIDEVVVVCTTCATPAHRVKEVLDVWFDSGAMPFAQHHYPFEDPDMIDARLAYPADYIAEAIDQTRGWFYTLLAVASLLGLEAPYRHVMCLGHINDARGHKMSKSKGNVVDPWELIAEHGADAVRMYMYTVNQPGEAKRFDAKDVREVVRATLLILWNVLTFYELYAQMDESHKEGVSSDHPMDRWIISRLHGLVRDTTRDLEEYRIFEGGRRLQEFVGELSTWYLRRSRDRFKEEGVSRTQALATLQEVLETLAKLMAPFMPFIADEVYMRVAKGEVRESVHLEDWPRWTEECMDAELETQMATLRDAVEMLHALRAETGMKVRQPLKAAVLSTALPSLLHEIIAEEVNVKEVLTIETLSGESGYGGYKEQGALKVALDTTMNDELIEEGVLREMVRQINALRKEMKLSVQDTVFLFITTEDPLLTRVLAHHGEALAKSVLAHTVKHEVRDEMREIEVNGAILRVHIVV